MSGSGGGGGGGGPDYAPPKCEDLVIDTQLSSPKPKVVALLQVGYQLQIELRQMDATTVVVALYQGDVAGGLASPEIQRLRECIAKGVGYVATVTAINSGQVRVRVVAVP